jgi:DNA (cytosine-5)-methyltransferase 1
MSQVTTERERALTLKEAAMYLQIGIEKLRRQAGCGAIPGRKIGRDWRFSRAGGGWGGANVKPPPRCLDLFCGGGGAAMGLHRAGFDVVGVDLHAQPRYPFEFHQADAMTYPLDGFDLIWASPPCQRFSMMRTMHKREHADLLTPTRERFASLDIPWVIENVPNAPLHPGSLMLCGTMFGLGVGDAELRRHRYFETPFLLIGPQCQHQRARYFKDGVPQQRTVGVYGGGGRDRRRPRTVGVWGNACGSSVRDGCQAFSTEERRVAMGIDWMTGKELSQAIPPAYSQWIGLQMLERIGRRIQTVEAVP